MIGSLKHNDDRRLRLDALGGNIAFPLSKEG